MQKNPQKRNTEDTAFLYRELAQSLRFRITTGEVAPGDKLPSIRQLCRSTGHSVTTVSKSLAELQVQGLIEARPRSGYVVLPRVTTLDKPKTKGLSDHRPRGISQLAEAFVQATADSSLIPFGGSSLDSSLIPQKRVASELRRAATQESHRLFRYGDPAGHEPLRELLLRRTFSKDSQVSIDSIQITMGCTDAIRIALSCVCRPGDRVAVESPTFFGFLRLIQLLGLQAVEVPCDPQTGLDVSLLQKAIRSTPVRALLVTPNFQNPTGALMPLENKRALAALTQRHGITIIESDVYSELSFDGKRPPSLFSLAGEGVILCGSPSKTLMPGLRVGWLVSREHRACALQNAAASYVCAPLLPQIALTRLLVTGEYDRHLRRLSPRLYGQVLSYSRGIDRFWPATTRLSRPQGGYLLWAQVEDLDAGALFVRARAQGIAIMPGEMGSLSPGYENYVRINCGTPWKPTVEKAIQNLGQMISDLLQTPNSSSVD